MRQIRAQVIAELGAYKAVTDEGNGTFLAHFQHGTATAQIHLDRLGRIDGLRVADLQHPDSSAGGGDSDPTSSLSTSC
ncbi:MAG: hypothetical protein ACRDIE_00320, partial [Chloroflexota bacterium]